MTILVLRLTPASADSGCAAPRRCDLPECAIIEKVSRLPCRCRRAIPLGGGVMRLISILLADR